MEADTLLRLHTIVSNYTESAGIIEVAVKLKTAKKFGGSLNAFPQKGHLMGTFAKTSYEASRQLLATGLNQEQVDSVIAARHHQAKLQGKPAPAFNGGRTIGQLKSRWEALKSEGYSYKHETGRFADNQERVSTRHEILSPEGETVGTVFTCEPCDSDTQIEMAVSKIEAATEIAKLEEDLFEMEYYGYSYHIARETDYYITLDNGKKIYFIIYGFDITIYKQIPEDGQLPPRPPCSIVEEVSFTFAPDQPNVASQDMRPIYLEILSRMHKLAAASEHADIYNARKERTFNYQPPSLIIRGADIVGRVSS